MADNIVRRGLRPRYDEFGGTSAGARNRYYRSDSGAGVSTENSSDLHLATSAHLRVADRIAPIMGPAAN
jgi:hypothetical protein